MRNQNLKQVSRPRRSFQTNNMIQDIGGKGNDFLAPSFLEEQLH